MTTDRYQSALAHVRNAAQNAALFKVGMCKQRTRIAFGVLDSKSDDATEAWTETKQRINVTLDTWRPAILWWTGGSEGHGHVAFTDPTPGLIWTVDFPTEGRWNLVSKARLEKNWPNLRYAGASLDIDGVPVIEAPRPATGQPNITHAIQDLTKARDHTKPGPRRRRIREILVDLRNLKRGKLT